MKNALQKVLTSILVLTLTLTSINLLSIHNTAEAATVYNPEVSKPASGNIFVSLNGSYLTASEKELVNKINKIRYEACKEGVINPETGKKLTLKDYKPVSWSTNLEAIARLRASEASVNWAHVRPNKKSAFTIDSQKAYKLTSGYHSGENLSNGYSLLKSIDAYYTEKAIYVNKKAGVTGHYTNMISPSNTLVGMAGFQQTKGSIFSAMEFGTLWTSKDTNNHARKGISGSATQNVEVNVAYLVNSFSISGSKSIVAGKSTKLTVTANMKNATKTASVSAGLTWKSSNTKVATVDSNGNVKGIAAGTATITASAGGKSVSFKITVTKAIKATSIKLDTTSISLKVNKTYQLKTTVNPSNTTNKAVSYSSSNTSIATVDSNGKITAKKAGTVTITVTTKDDSNKSAKVTVKVTK